MAIKTGPLHGQKVGGHRIAQFQKFTPEQMDLLKQMQGMVGPESYLSKLAGGDPEMMAEMEAPALKQFSGFQGQLGSRFSGMGMGGQKSSGFRNTANQAASDFAQQLQANRQQLQRQAIMDMMGISQSLLNQDPYETMMYERKHHGPSSAGKGTNWGGIGGATIGGLGGFFLGGPTGAAGGASAGYNIGSGITGKSAGGGTGSQGMGNWGGMPSGSYTDWLLGNIGI